MIQMVEKGTKTTSRAIVENDSVLQKKIHMIKRL